MEGHFDVEGVTFTAANMQEGWRGLWFEPGSGGTIDGATIERVHSYGGSSVYITDASPTFRNTRVWNDAGFGTGGFYVSGSAAAPVFESNFVENLSGDGFGLGHKAEARLIQNIVRDNGGDGLTAVGSATEAFLSPPFGSSPDDGEFGNRIERNGGHGLYASYYADLTLGYYYYAGSNYHADGFNTVTGNTGAGVNANYYGRIAAGNSSSQQRNRFFNNTANDAEATGSGARLWALCNWWNDTSPPFRTAESGGGILDDDAYLLADPYVDPDALCVESSTTFRTGTAAQPRSAGDSSRGEERTPRGLLIAAAEVIDRSPVAAIALLGQVIEQTDDESLAATALAEVGYVLAQADLPAPVRASAEALLDEAATGSRPALRVAALSALVAVRQAQGDGAGALDAAAALVESAENPDEAFFGHLARVYLYAEAGREDEAWAALAEVEEHRPESAEAEMARRHLEGPSGADGAGRSAARAAAASTESEAADADLGFRLAPVYPNPMRRVGTVTFALDEASEVRVVVYDVLGREVAVLADGAFEPGTHDAALDAAALPSGVYLVRLVAGDRAATQPITVLR